MYSASTIAKWFLAWADLTEEGESDITALKLQKLLYYAQGHFVAETSEKLFSEQIKAWAHGPVVPQIWHEYRAHGSAILPAPSETEFSWDEVKDEDEEVLVKVWNTYGGYSAWYLRNKTHKEAPWIDAYGRGESIIEADSLAKHFSPL